MTTPRALARTTYHGKSVDEATKAAIEQAEAMLGYELTIVQGSFNTSVSASAGTHNEGRVIDFAPFDWRAKVKALRLVGFAAFHRTPIPGVWGEHIHACLILNSWDNADGIAPLAFAQIGDYRHDRNGLAGHGPDVDWRPSPLRLFTYPPKEPAVPVFKNNVTEARDALVEASHALGTAAAKLQAAPKSRLVVRGQVLTTKAALRSVNGILHVLPKK